MTMPLEKLTPEEFMRTVPCKKGAGLIFKAKIEDAGYEEVYFVCYADGIGKWMRVSTREDLDAKVKEFRPEGQKPSGRTNIPGQQIGDPGE